LALTNTFFVRVTTDINRIHPVDTQGVQNLQSSTTGHYILDEHESKARARIMVINNSHDRGNGGYVGLMNSVFAAQKRVGSNAIMTSVQGTNRALDDRKSPWMC
jgi:hypothetical protein